MDEHIRKTQQPKVAGESPSLKHMPYEAPSPDTRPEMPPAQKQRRRFLGFLLGLLVIVALGYAVYRVVAPSRPASPHRALAPQSVGVATIGRGDIRLILNGLGTVTPLATVTVRTQINGELQTVGFREGQMVKRGDFLAQIDPRPYELAEQQYEGQLLHDQGLLNQARTDLVRYQALVKQNSIARQQAEDQAFIVNQYEGSVKLDQAQINNQKLNIEYCHIVAPVTGRIGLRLVDPGNYVQTSDTNGIAVVTKIQPISVIFSLPEDNIPETVAQMKAGVVLTAAAYDRANINRLATGKVETIDNEIDTTTGMVKFRANFPNEDAALFPNQFVNVRLLLRVLGNVVTAPNVAIQRGAPGTYVYVVNANNTVSVRKVKLGPTDGDLVQILSGLTPGDRVVTDGIDRLHDGAHVRIPASAPDHHAGSAVPTVPQPSHQH